MSWAETYGPHYDKLSHAARARRKLQERRSRAQAAARNHLIGDTTRSLIEYKRNQKQARHKLEKLRLSKGFVYRGGLVGQNLAYPRTAFVHRGLVSDQHPILKLYVSKLPRARWTRDPSRRLKSGNTKALMFEADSKLLALDDTYVEANKICCGILRIEIDRDLTATEVRQACAAAGLPLPNVMVGHVTPGTEQMLHPHLVWLLEHSVSLTKTSPLKWLYSGVLRGLTQALVPVGADLGGLFNAHRLKNAVSPQWSRVVLAQAPYELRNLAACVDVCRPRKTVAEGPGLAHGGLGFGQDHPDPEIAVGSNRTFRMLALWARREVIECREACLEKAEFAERVETEAFRLTAGLTGDSRRRDKATCSLAKSVSNWTWDKYHPAPQSVMLSLEARAAAQAEGGRKAAGVRKTRSIALILAKARALADDLGQTPTKAAVVAALLENAGCCKRTVERQWPAVAEVMATWTFADPLSSNPVIETAEMAPAPGCDDGRAPESERPSDVAIADAGQKLDEADATGPNPKVMTATQVDDTEVRIDPPREPKRSRRLLPAWLSGRNRNPMPFHAEGGTGADLGERAGTG